MSFTDVTLVWQDGGENTIYMVISHGFPSFSTSFPPLFPLVVHCFLFTSGTVVACVTTTTTTKCRVLDKSPAELAFGRTLKDFFPSNLLFSIPRFVGIACPWGQLDDSMCDWYHGVVDYYWLVWVGWWLFILQLC